MVAILLVANYVEVPRQLITMQVASYRHESALSRLASLLDQIVRVLLPFFTELLLDGVPLRRCQIMQLALLSRCCRVSRRLRNLGLWLRLALDWSKFLLQLLLLLGAYWGSLVTSWLIRIAKEKIVICFVHEASLVALDDRHVIDCTLGCYLLLSLRNHTSIEERVLFLLLLAGRLTYQVLHFTTTAKAVQHVAGRCAEP